MKCSRLAFFFFLIAFVGQHVPAQLQLAKPKSVCAKPLLVGANNYAPFAYREKGQIKGMVHDLLMEIREKTGCQFIESEVSRVVATDQMMKDRIDIVAMLVRAQDLEVKGEFVPLYKIRKEILVSKKIFTESAKFEDYLQNEKLKFAYLIGSRTVVGADLEEKLLKSSRLVGVPDPEQAFRLLREGRVQALLFTTPVAAYYTEKMQMEDLVARVEDPGADIPVGFYFSKLRMSTEEKSLMAKAVDDIKKDGSFLRIFSKYIPRHEGTIKD